MTPLMLNQPRERQREIMAPQAMSRVGTPEEVAAAVVWLCSDEASFVTGVALPVDAGSIAWISAHPHHRPGRSSSTSGARGGVARLRRRLPGLRREQDLEVAVAGRRQRLEGGLGVLERDGRADQPLARHGPLASRSIAAAKSARV